MQSSTAIAIRALVMLIVLISVPLFAIFGKNLPDVFKGVMEGRGLVLGPAPGGQANPQAASPLPTADNPFGQSAPYRAVPEGSFAQTPSAAAPNAVAVNPNSAVSGTSPQPSSVGIPNAPGPTANVWPGAPSTTGSAPGDWRNAPPSPSMQPASFQAPPEATPIASPEVAGARGLGSGVRGPEISVRSQEPAASIGAVPGGNAAPGYPKTSASRDLPPSPVAVSADDKFRRAEMRLRELGASHYMLETWGADNSSYRFVCKMAIAGNPGMHRMFHATGADPWRTMEQVLHEVEDWRNPPRQ